MENLIFALAQKSKGEIPVPQPLVDELAAKIAAEQAKLAAERAAAQKQDDHVAKRTEKTNNTVEIGRAHV